ncbi:MAG: NifB/NifX family molybdenum-iron cluster-binding protein [Candidatus Zixiibacteriota bacterium]
MKIAISSQGEDLEAMVDPRFGRCTYFIIYDSETKKIEGLSNPALEAMGGAGILAAQLIADKGAEVVITGNVGPNAFQTLNQANIKIYGGASGTVKDSLKKFENGELNELSNSSVPRHFGMEKDKGGS